MKGKDLAVGAVAAYVVLDMMKPSDEGMTEWMLGGLGGGVVDAMGIDDVTNAIKEALDELRNGGGGGGDTSPDGGGGGGGTQTRPDGSGKPEWGFMGWLLNPLTDGLQDATNAMGEGLKWGGIALGVGATATATATTLWGYRAVTKNLPRIWPAGGRGYSPMLGETRTPNVRGTNYRTGLQNTRPVSPDANARVTSTRAAYNAETRPNIARNIKVEAGQMHYQPTRGASIRWNARNVASKVGRTGLKGVGVLGVAGLGYGIYDMLFGGYVKDMFAASPENYTSPFEALQYVTDLNANQLIGAFPQLGTWGARGAEGIPRSVLQSRSTGILHQMGVMPPYQQTGKVAKIPVRPAGIPTTLGTPSSASMIIAQPVGVPAWLGA